MIGFIVILVGIAFTFAGTVAATVGGFIIVGGICLFGWELFRGR